MVKIFIKTKLLFLSLRTIKIRKNTLCRRSFFLIFDFPLFNLIKMGTSSVFIVITVKVATHLIPRATLSDCSH